MRLRTAEDVLLFASLPMHKETFKGELDSVLVKLLVAVFNEDVRPEVRRLLYRGHRCCVECDPVLLVALLAAFLVFTARIQRALSFQQTFPSSSALHLVLTQSVANTIDAITLP